MAEQRVRSPLPGVFYRKPAPDQPPFAEVGDTVSTDQTIGIVEIMKQFSPVAAGFSGRLTAFVAQDEAVVGPGDTIATIDED